MTHTTTRRAHRVLPFTLACALALGCATASTMKPSSNSSGGVAQVYDGDRSTVFSAAQDAVLAAGLELLEAAPDETYLIGSEGMSGNCYGVRVGVYLDDHGDGTVTVRVDNKKVLATNIFCTDYTQTLHAQISRSLSRAQTSAQPKVAAAPEVTLSSPTGDKVATREATVIVSARGAKAIARVELTRNGQRVERATTQQGTRGAQLSEAWTVPLEPGSNVVHVSVTDEAGAVGFATLAIERTQAETVPLTTATTQQDRDKAYSASYGRRIAAVIGINTYEHWPALEGARRDASRMAATFRAMGFDEVIEVYDDDATRVRILHLLGEELPRTASREDLVVMFFAGHGQTETLSNGSKRGYIIPVDGTLAGVFSTAISMETLRDLSERLPAKHVYYAMDSCYSGLGFVRGVQTPTKTAGYLQKMTSRRAVQMITAVGG